MRQSGVCIHGIPHQHPCDICDKRMQDEPAPVAEPKVEVPAAEPIDEEQKNRDRAIKALDAWSRYSRRGPVYDPSPTGFSRPMGGSGYGEDPDAFWWRLVEEELCRFDSGAKFWKGNPKHPLRRLLHHVHAADGRSSAERRPETFNWQIPGLSPDELTYLLGMTPEMRARGDYLNFLAEIEKRIKRLEPRRRVTAQIADNALYPAVSAPTPEREEDEDGK